MIKVLLADDHQMFLDGLKELLNAIGNISVLGEANNGKDLLELLKAHNPDLVLMDVNMPEMDGIEATKAITTAYPEIKILMLTMFNTSDYVRKLLKAGAHGYILKNTGKEELANAINTLMNGMSFYSKEVTERIMDDMQKKKQHDNDYQIVELTEREKEVLILISQELTTREIAEQLNVSHHTIETHRKNLISKLNVRNVTGLVKYAVLQGLVD